MKIIDFLHQSGRKILISNKVSVGNTILRDININKGVDVFDVKVLKPADIAEELVYAYDAYEGRDARLILDAESAQKYMENTIISENLVSFPKRLVTDATVSDVYKCAAELRMNEVTAEWNESTDIKVIDLKKIISSYESAVQGDNALDPVMLILEATRIAKENNELLSMLLPWKSRTIIGSLESNAFSEAEEYFIKLIAGEGYADIEFLNAERTNGGAVTYSFYKAYGMVNEVNHVVREILRSKNPGKSALYYSVPAYVNFIKAAMENAGIPYRLTSGNPATETDLMQFILGLLDAAGNNFLYKDLKPVISNRLITFKNVAADELFLNPIMGYNEAAGHGIGWGHERYIKYIELTRSDCDALEANPSVTEYELRGVPLRREFALFLERYIDIFFDQDNGNCTERPITDMYERLIEFTQLYTFKINRDKLRLKKALEELGKKLRLVADGAFSLRERIEYLANMLRRLNFDDEAEGNAVLVSPITGFMAIDRPAVYVIGLSAGAFSLDTKQSPVLLDDEKKKYMVGPCDDPSSVIDLSFTRNPRRKLEMENSFRTIDHGQVCLVYNYYDTITLRDSSPSVFFIEMQGDDELKITQGYVEDDFLRSSMAGHTGNIFIDSEELRAALRAEDAKRKAAKALKEGKKAESADEIHEIEDEIEDVENEDEIEDAEIVAELKREAAGTSAADDLDAGTVEVKKKDLYISSTGIQMLLKCPISYYYCYTNHLRFHEELENTGYQWLDPASKGTLCHRVMDRYMTQVFPPARQLSAAVDMVLFEKIYDEEIKRIETELPAPSAAIKKREEKRYKELIAAYIERTHAAWIRDKADGKDYEVIGCELDFNGLEYSYAKSGKYGFEFRLTGSIDRVDGYVDGSGILQLRIIDYKTGKKESKAEEVKEGIQIQHFVYGMAAIEYIRKYLEDNNHIFAGKKVDDVNFEQVAYLFPYVEDDGSEDYDVLDVTDDVMECFETSGKKMEGRILLPETANDILSRIIGAMQAGNLNDLAKNSEEIINEKIAETIAEIRAEKFEREQEKAREKFEKAVFLGTNKTKQFVFTEADIEVNYGLEDFCNDNYCKYRNICRKWMGGDK